MKRDFLRKARREKRRRNQKKHDQKVHQVIQTSKIKNKILGDYICLLK